MNIALLNFRGLGDAMIMTHMLNAYASQLNSKNITIITWSKNEFIFSQLKIKYKLILVEDLYSNKLLSLLLVSVQLFKLIKNKKYDFAINFSGDFRENIYLYFFSSEKKISPFWSSGHDFNRIITQPIIRQKDDILIPKSIVNIYDVYDYFFKIVFNFESVLKKPPTLLNKVDSIGLFPFASQRCREWPMENWDKLGLELILKGFKVYYVCSDNEVKRLYSFRALEEGALLYSDYSSNIFEIKKYIDMAICLDSFSSHLSFFAEIPSIIIFGANLPKLFSTRGATIVSSNGGCNHYPCFNSPKCIDSDFKYACILNISVKNIMDKVDFCNVSEKFKR
jgi:heptosyltransferase III